MMHYKFMFKLLLLIFIILVIGCHEPIQRQFVLFDFESDSELDQLHWKCHTLMNLSDEHVSHGSKSLRLELYPSEYPGLSPMIRNNNWQGYESLGFDIFNPNGKEIKIAVRIDDRKDAPEYKDRYNHGFVLAPGLNRINISIDKLSTSGTNRRLDLKKIYFLTIFIVNPSEKVTLYVDYIRLERS
jgi:hypothetical protein